MQDCDLCLGCKFFEGHENKGGRIFAKCGAELKRGLPSVYKAADSGQVIVLIEGEPLPPTPNSGEKWLPA